MANTNFSIESLGTVSNAYGTTNSRYASGKHTGVDIVLKNKSVRSVAYGTVVKTSSSGAYGNHVWIKNNDGVYALYAHMQSPTPLKSGDKVTPGGLLGYEGSTGNSTGNHLHMEFRKDINDSSSTLDPVSYVNAFGSESMVGKSMQGVNGSNAGGVRDNSLFGSNDKGEGSFWEYLSENWQALLARVVLVGFGLFLLYAAIKKGFMEG